MTTFTSCSIVGVRSMIGRTARALRRLPDRRRGTGVLLNEYV